MALEFRIATTQEEFEEGKSLFQEYADHLNLDLSFQDFETELKNIHKQYNRPEGALILAYQDDKPVGCGAIRKLEDEIAELKRMFIKKEHRGAGFGQNLLKYCLEVAVKLHYKKIRLDTLPDMIAAQRLYRQSGFYDIEPYRYNPIKGTVFMEKDLTR